MLSTDFFVDKDIKYADKCIDGICNAIKHKDSEAIKSLFSNTAHLEAENLDNQIIELFKFVDEEPVSWSIDESPLVKDVAEFGNVSKHQMFWFSLKTTKENYSVFLSYYPIDNIEPNNKGIYSMLIIRECDEDKLKGSINEWSAIPGITFN